MNRTHLYTLAGLLAALGGGFFLYKLLWLGFPLVPETRSEVWRVEVQVQFEAGGGPARANLFVPRRTDDLTIVEQSFVSPGYGVVTQQRPGHGMQAIYSIGEARGLQSLFYRVVVQPTRVTDSTSRDPVPRLDPPVFEGARLAAAESVVLAARKQSYDARLFATFVLRALAEARPEGEAEFLVGRNPTPRHLMSVAAQLIEFGGVPARPVHGIVLDTDRRDAPFVHWLEIYHEGRWQRLLLDPSDRAASRLLLPWWRGDGPLAEISGGTALRHTVSTSRSYELATQTALNQQRALERQLVDLSLFGLPLQSQALFRTLMVIPAGILLLVLLRNVVGLKTFGTFMPVLIALAFRQTGVGWGVAFLCVVVGLGLAVRFYLDRLKLLVVPRLAAIVIAVILIIAALTVITFKLGIVRGLSIGLFPIVIMTMVIERMTVVWEERGPVEALQQGFGSIVVGVLCFFLMNLPVVEHLFFVFPELLLVMLAAVLLLGRYSGYRLTELYRFRVLAR